MWESFLENKGVELPSDDYIWELAREHKEISIFENIYMAEVLAAIGEFFYKLDPRIKVNIIINCSDSHLNINGEDIYSHADFGAALFAYR